MGLHFLNESGRYPAHLRWKLRGSFFVFKFCEDVKQIPILIDYFPNCRIIHLTRDIRDIIYTICYPSENSWPIRKVEDFPKIQEIQKSLDCSLINAIAKFIEIHYCLEDWDNSIDKKIDNVYYEDFTIAKRGIKICKKIFS